MICGRLSSGQSGDLSIETTAIFDILTGYANFGEKFSLGQIIHSCKECSGFAECSSQIVFGHLTKDYQLEKAYAVPITGAVSNPETITVSIKKGGKI